ncbi:MAG TPA: bile acid:sodium symporter [archaeon]|nr:bile acid:sodium symporter [archaeon]
MEEKKFKELVLYAAIISGDLFGFVIPSQGLLFAPYVAQILMALIFLTSLRIEVAHVLSDFRKPKAILWGVALCFGLAPLAAVLAGTLAPLAPMTLLGAVLYFSAPAASGTAFFSDVLRGKPSLGLSISAVTLLLSIIAVPALVYLIAGSVVEIDALKIVATLAQVILLPFALAVLSRKHFKKATNALLGQSFNLSAFLIFLVNFAFVAAGYQEIAKDFQGFIYTSLLMGALVGLSYAAAYYAAKLLGFEKSERVTLTISTAVKNGGIGLIVALAAFGTAPLPALIAGGVFNVLLLIPFGIILGAREARGRKE